MSRLDDLAADYQRKAVREGFHDGAGGAAVERDPIVDAQRMFKTTRDYQLRGWLSDFMLRVYGAQRADLCPEGSEATVALDALVAVLGASSLYQARMAARIALQTIKATTTGAT